MTLDKIYSKQAELLLRILPLIDRESVFALKGGTAINFFVRDLPRISVDIDLVYLPVGERNEALYGINAALERIAADITSRIPETKIMPRKTAGSDLLSGLFVQRQEATVKIEANLIIRGSVYPSVKRTMSRKAVELFETSVACRMLSENELYGGKICAALDRQHPRDLFDILMLFRHGDFSADMRNAFIVYLISHDRPMVELLNPRFADIRFVLQTEFLGMTWEKVDCEELEKTRSDLVSIISNRLTDTEKLFIMSVKEGKPRWDLIDIPGIENLPAVKWKLLNIGRMTSAKHKKAIKKLRDYLQI